MKEKRPSFLRKVAYRIARLVYFSKHFSYLSYNLGFQGKLVINNISVNFDIKKKGEKKLKILFLSDLHFGKIVNDKLIETLEDHLFAIDFDLLFLGGDYIFLEKKAFVNIKTLLKKIFCPLGKFAVLGNHDRWLLNNDLTSDFEECGVTLLVNKEVTLKHPYNFIKIFGIDDLRYGNPEIKLSQKEEGEKRIFLCHSPEGLSLSKEKNFDFALFGHTHGGQIVFNQKKPFLPFKDKYSKKFPRGLFNDNEFDFPFYVSSGIGFVWLPVRFNCPSEIVLIELY